MTARVQPHPPLARGSMRPVPWAGALRRRVWRRRAGSVADPVPGREGDHRPLRLRRLALLVLVVLGGWIGARAMAQVLPGKGDPLAELGLVVLFGILFAWVSAGFWTGVMGVFVRLSGDAGPLARGAREAGLRPLDPTARTAIVMPICNEHVPTVFGGLAATIGSLEATGEAGNFDVYVLSDTSDPDTRAAEHAAWSDLAERCAAGGLKVHYRWRRRRVQRKAGNVADFCRRWGRGYRYFVVLDADSVMTGECLTTLVRRMESHPEVGILQTAPQPYGHETFHARVQQFCAAAYGPLFTAGMRFWQLGESHYWGHNAILRMEPFMRHCALAPIEGKGSLAGDILSHDFVEAALMRRAGWQVWVADDLDGSYEQVPPNLLEELQRDRRWCRGNLQNARLAFEPGLHAVHRVNFLTGAMAYASSPLWLAFLLLSSLLFAQHAGTDPVYFVEPYQLFPIWPSADLKLMLTLFGLTAVLLLAPKVLSLVAIGARGEAAAYGGTGRLLAGALVEFLHSVLLAPVRMLFHTQFVLGALSGWKLDWKSPPRDEARTTWREALARHGWHTAGAVLWIAAIVATSAAIPWWLAPVLLGLVAAAPLSVWGSSTGVGRALRRGGLLLTPEETRVPPVLAAAEREAAAVAERLVDLRTALRDPEAAARVAAGAPPQGPARFDTAKARAATGRLERAVDAGPSGLDAAERMRLLSSRAALATLRAEIDARRAHDDWHVEPAPPEAAVDASPRQGWPHGGVPRPAVAG